MANSSGNRSIIDVGAMDLYQEITDYGKNANADTIDIATDLATATITAIGAGKQLNGGDLIYCYPSLISADGATPTDTETLIFDVHYYKNREGWKTTTVTTTFATPADLDAGIVQIETELTTLEINSLLELTNTGGKLRIQATGLGIGFKITGGTGLTNLGLEVGDYATPIAFKASQNITTVATSVLLAEYYFLDATDYDTVASLSDLQYQVLRSMGQSTGSTLNTSMTDDVYKGSSKVPVQVEYGEGDSMFDVTALTFNRENLDNIFGLKKRTGTFFSGKACDAKYKYGGYVTIPEFCLMAFSPMEDGIGLRHTRATRAKAQGFTIPMGKEFRVSDVTFMLLADSDRKVATIYTM